MTKIGASDLDVFPLAFGGNVFGWTVDRGTSFDLLDAFVAGGGNFIDTADSYSFWASGNQGGESELIIGEWLQERGNRDQVVLATKVSQLPEFAGLKAANIHAGVKASLERLREDTIDLYYAHFDDPSTPLEESAEAFDALVRAGTVRHVALSNFTGDRIQAWLDVCDANGFVRPVAVQPLYNLVAREPFESSIEPIARREGLGVIPYPALAGGFLTGKYRTGNEHAGSARSAKASQLVTPANLAVIDALEKIGTAHNASITTTAIAWLLAKPTVVAPIASASTLGQLPDLLAAADLKLDTEEVELLDRLSDPAVSG